MLAIGSRHKAGVHVACLNLRHARLENSCGTYIVVGFDEIVKKPVNESKWLK